MWSRTTAQGVSLGCVLGAVCSLSCWLIHASTYENGLGDFIANTGINSFIGEYGERLIYLEEYRERLIYRRI